jgi:hypothetical protein
MPDIFGIAVTILILGAMFGGFAKSNSKEDKESIWKIFIVVIAGLFVFGLLFNNNSNDNRTPLCDISQPGCDDNGPDPELPDPDFIVP